MASRQATSNKRQRAIRRTFGLCARCGGKGCGAYCRRNADARRAYMARYMKARRAKAKAKAARAARS